MTQEYYVSSKFWKGVKSIVHIGDGQIQSLLTKILCPFGFVNFRPEADSVVGEEVRSIYIMMAASMKKSQLRKTLKVITMIISINLRLKSELGTINFPH